MGDRRPETGDRRPETEDRRPETEVGSRKWLLGWHPSQIRRPYLKKYLVAFGFCGDEVG